MPPVVCVVGRDGSGKTRIIEAIAREMKARGHRVATVARSAEGPALESVTKDAERYASAGSDVIVVGSRTPSPACAEWRRRRRWTSSSGR